MDSYSYVAGLISPTRIKILRELRGECHPEVLAKKFKMTRQGMDKHLAILYQAGLVDKIIKDDGRPMTYYTISQEGECFLQNFVDLVDNLVIDLKKRRKYELMSLDRDLVEDKLNEKEYLIKKKKIESRFKWVMQ